MMTATAMQFSMSSPLARVANRSGMSQFLPSTYAPRLTRSASFRVRSTAEEQQQPQQPTPEVNPPPQPQPPKPQPTKVHLKMSTKFSDLFAFSGPAPERINGRLAMVGFVAALAVELSRGQDVFGQISEGGIPWFLGTSIVLSLASLIPLSQGVSVESKSKGVMTSDAEMWNGRLAMLGLVALAFTEYVKGGTLV